MRTARQKNIPTESEKRSVGNLCLVKRAEKKLFKKISGKIGKRPFRKLRPDRTAGKLFGKEGAADAERNH